MYFLDSFEVTNFKNFILFPFLEKSCWYTISLHTTLEERGGEDYLEDLLIIV